jgi:hypothetical protein
VDRVETTIRGECSVTIKETAGKILLYFYQLQRTVPASMTYRQLGFIDKTNGGVSLTTDKKWLTKDLLDINPQPTDVFNAYIYLIDKGYISTEERTASGKKIFVGVRVTGTGIDIVEGIERGKDGQHDFTTIFNISVTGHTKVESLIKENLSNLLEES